ncbi:hypothetical protein TIN4_78 [Tsukamurella phage TIN4]|uniref:DNA-binding phage zinc finger domain-containing protein n=2 Tax=Tinduovirus TIN3 TaxID=1982571 RepID=A0A0K0N639_9CAUD|nr:hypothetical protein AVT54_gp047 [Tsukamurella phage TIN3]YP_009604208.1 hypothetical protein FDH87_gp047 [Tsukamurella phage TIN4]AKJ71875.1 hypothetical protein TIN3_78 [Tsukamurella phage TIN3]AKJ71984.1 hypothetical protein TIN4_78 [Tsukamurella phage TIN4]
MSETGMISSCTSCGGSVIWAKRADEPSRWSQPLEANSVRSGVFLDGEGFVRPIVSYNYHKCSVEDVKAYLEVMEAKAQIKEVRKTLPPREIIDLDNDIRKKKYDEEITLRYTEALTDSGYIVNSLIVDCPRCGSNAGEFCVDMRKGERYNGKDVRNPHKPRVDAALSEIVGDA